MKQYTDITILLDRSGSMATIKESMETAFNKFIEEHKRVKSTRLTLIQFDSVNPQQVVFQNLPISAVEGLNLNPRGGTPLIDAFVRAIDGTGERLSAMEEHERPDQVLFVVITDGEENDSKTYRRSDVSSRVHKQHDHYKWQFIYLGANQDAIKEAASYGIRQDWAITYNANPAAVNNSWASLVNNTLSYTSSTGGARGSSVKSFTDLDRKNAATVDNSVQSQGTTNNTNA